MQRLVISTLSLMLLVVFGCGDEGEMMVSPTTDSLTQDIPAAPAVVQQFTCVAGFSGHSASVFRNPFPTPHTDVHVMLGSVQAHGRLSEMNCTPVVGGFSCSLSGVITFTCGGGKRAIFVEGTLTVQLDPITGLPISCTVNVMEPIELGHSVFIEASFVCKGCSHLHVHTEKYVGDGSVCCR